MAWARVDSSEEAWGVWVFLPAHLEPRLSSEQLVSEEIYYPTISVSLCNENVKDTLMAFTCVILDKMSPSSGSSCLTVGRYWVVGVGSGPLYSLVFTALCVSQQCFFSPSE